MNTRDFLEGKSFDGYKFFGAHKKDKGYIFRVLAPNADRVSIIGDFNDWQKQNMRKYSTGVFSITIDDAKIGDTYQYVINSNDQEFKKIDPFAKSIIYDEKSAQIVDDSYKYKYKYKSKKKLPQTILQVYLGTLFNNKARTADEIYKDIINHAKDNSYTSILLMPVNEYQNYKSLGYSSLNLFSFSKRYGGITSFRKFVDECHKENLQIISELDISEFDPDLCGLSNFDGTALYDYEYQDIYYNYYEQANFDISGEISKSYIKSAVDFYITYYNLDGIYFSSIENSIYWQGDVDRGINRNWVDFIKEINEYILSKEAISLASFNGIYNMDLGFSYVYDFKSKTLINMLKDEPYKRNHYKKHITDLIKNYDNKSILGFSYVDSYQNEANLAMKVYSDDKKLNQLKSLFLFLFSLKSPKLLFMGDDSGDLRTFSQYQIFNFDDNRDNTEYLNDFYKDIAKLYLDTDALSNPLSKTELFDVEGYSLYAYKRVYKNNAFLVVVNFTDIDYQIESPFDLVELINTEDLSYKGSGNINGNISKGDILNIEAYSSAIFKIK